MAHQDFEKYAREKPMRGKVSDLYKSIFKKEILPQKNSSLTILDFGCGDGKYFTFFKKYTSPNNIHGVEISKTRVSACERIGWENVIQIKAVKKLPFPNNYFDFINFDQVIEHIRKEEIDFYIKEFKRVLKPHGKIIVITPNYPIKRFYDFLNTLTTKNFSKLKDDPTHITFYNSKKLEQIFSKHNFTIRIKPTGGFLYKLFPVNFFSHKIVGICYLN